MDASEQSTIHNPRNNPQSNKAMDASEQSTIQQSSLTRGYSLRIRLTSKKNTKIDRKQIAKIYYQNKRVALKCDHDKYLRYKRNDATKKRSQRRNMTEEQRKKYNEATRLRMRKMRAKMGNPGKVLTRKETEKQREAWRDAKKRQRQKMTKAQRERERQDRKRRYHEKVKSVRKKLDFSTTAQQTDPLTSPDIVSIIGSATPNTKKQLKDDNVILTPKSRLQSLTDKRISRNIRISIKELKTDRTKYGRSKYQSVVRAACRKAVKDMQMRRRLEVGRHFWKRATACEENEVTPQERSNAMPGNIKQEIVDFYDEHADALPCKKTVSKEAVQKKVLRTTLKELHADYQKATNNQISLSAFRKLRPKECLCVDANKFAYCLCEYCINAEFNLRALKNMACQNSCSLRITTKFAAVDSTLCEEKMDCLSRKCRDCGIEKLKETLKADLKPILQREVKWQKWRTGTVGKTSRKILVDLEGTVSDCINDLSEQLESLAMHLFTAKWQRKQVEQLKENLPEDWLVSILDFSENYRCSHQDEIQSAYYNYTQATLLPMVLYYKCPNCKELEQESCVFITPDLSHDAHYVDQCNQKALNHLRTNRNLHISHHVQVSDGCGFQFKSKVPFKYLSEMPNTERVYFGSRHGKSYCDSLGGIVKNAAERAVKARTAKITNAQELFDFCCRKLEIDHDKDKETCCHKKRKFFFDAEVNRPEEVERLLPLPRTQSLHQVRYVAPGIIQGRRFACFCSSCLLGNNEACTNSSQIEGTWDSLHNVFMKDAVKKPETEKKKGLKKRGRREKKSTLKVEEKLEVDNKAIQAQKRKKGKLKKHPLKENPEVENKTDQVTKEQQGRKKKKNPKSEVKKPKVEKPFQKNSATDMKIEQLLFLPTVTNLKCAIDGSAMELLPDDVKERGLYPVLIEADGNCLSRSISLVIYGTQEYYMDLKEHLVSEMTNNREYYLDKYSEYAIYSHYFRQGMSVRRDHDLKSVYDAEITAAGKDGEYLSMWHLAAFATVSQRVIYSVYPTYGSHNVRKHYHRKLEPRNNSESSLPPIHIMWSRHDGKTVSEKIWSPNHFVPLLSLHDVHLEHVHLEQENDTMDCEISFSELQEVIDVDPPFWLDDDCKVTDLKFEAENSETVYVWQDSETILSSQSPTKNLHEDIFATVGHKNENNRENPQSEETEEINRENPQAEEREEIYRKNPHEDVLTKGEEREEIERESPLDDVSTKAKESEQNDRESPHEDVSTEAEEREEINRDSPHEDVSTKAEETEEIDRKSPLEDVSVGKDNEKETNVKNLQAKMRWTLMMTSPPG